MADAPVIETCGLSHCFADGNQVLHNLDLRVPSGCIYGFLGANGAGKTTTLRLLLGLLRVQQGTVRILGESLGQNRLGILRRVGAMIESPSLYGHLSATDNLRVLREVHQCPEARVMEVLRLVGLADTGRKKAVRFSLGMRQRLSIAMALLHQPGLLILDEPTNGLDPNGMIEVRELLRYLNRQHGITVVVSSHILGEIEKLVDHVGIIHHGQLLFQGTLGGLQQVRAARHRLVLGTSDPERTFALLQARGLAPGREAAGISLPALEPDGVAALVRDLVGAGIGVHEVSARRNDLEGIFIEMITG